MRFLIAMTLTGLLGSGLLGCSDTKSSVKQETEIQTPNGKTTITTEKEIKKSGDNPPAAP